MIRMNFRAPKNVRYECQRCARCCGDTSHRGRNILLLPSEVEQISSHTGLRPLSFASPASNGVYRYRMKKRSGKCVFLEGKACRIYDIRPVICRFYPFSVKRYNGTYMFEVSRDCPGIGLGNLVPPEHFERMVKKASEALQARN
ncbi:MAG TPA: YkgJ family cysteine cluster protein [Hadesarchaea archaeon]|nr:YkgJ family cysteine cluster protein [Hadesarchaea archaeon]